MDFIEKYQGFENWLKANNYVSWKSYLSFMKVIENTLMVKEFSNITSTSILQQLFNQLQTNRSFAARSKSDRDNILSGFRTYIDYIKEKKQSTQK
jgi:hypothetical protein